MAAGELFEITVLVLTIKNNYFFMELSGKVYCILPPIQFTSKKSGTTDRKYGFVIETQGMYPKKVAFSVMGDERYKAMRIAEGFSYNVSFDVHSREYNGRWYTELDAWKVVPLSAAPTTSTTSTSNDLPY